MPDRMQFTMGQPAVGADAATHAIAAPRVSPPRQVPPAGSCDCHVHVLDPERFRYQDNRRYTPGVATITDLRTMHSALGVERVVVVQNSVYGTDNACLLDALRQLRDAARGVAVIAPTTTGAEIEELDRAGVRGVRINLTVTNTSDTRAAAGALRVSARIPPTWHLHLNAELSLITALYREIAELPNSVVLDHFAHARAEAGPWQPGVAEVIALMRAKQAVVKFSGLHQVSGQTDYADVSAIARVYAEAAPDQVIWGSDWPHTGGISRPADQGADVLEPFRPEDDGRNFDLLAEWVPDPWMRRRILVDTPARLYGFKPTAGERVV